MGSPEHLLKSQPLKFIAKIDGYWQAGIWRKYFVLLQFNYGIAVR